MFKRILVLAVVVGSTTLCGYRVFAGNASTPDAIQCTPQQCEQLCPSSSEQCSPGACTPCPPDACPRKG